MAQTSVTVAPVADETAEERPRTGAGGGTASGERWADGLRIGLGLGTAVFVLALSFGALARAQGWSLLQATVGSLLVFSGSAQFALLTGLPAGGALPAVGAAVLVNLRFAPLAAAATSSLRGGKLRRSMEAQGVVDGSWVAAYRGGGRFARPVLLGASLVQWPAWVAGTLIGALLAPSPEVLHRWGLDVVFPAFYLLLLLDLLRDPASRPPALLGAALAGVLLLVAPAGVALLAASAAALVGLRSRTTSGGRT
jgi:predicted branched-subunit amino acid permease